jgi:glycosyltransferase involved in cell wall biosynthesis
VDGKFFRLGEKKFYVKGLAYGPFAPNEAGEPFASPEQTERDFVQMRQLGANLIRVYHVPAQWFLDAAAAHELKVFIDIPWNKHVCFLDGVRERAEARQAVRRAVSACSKHPAVFAFSVANELPPDIVRWSSASAVTAFIDDLVLEAKEADPDCLCTFTNYPPTEFLRPRSLDFVCFNVYLHQEQAFHNYLGRLQMVAESKPLLLGEFGIDSLREGEERKCEMLAWQIEGAFRRGLAGVVVFSFTDDWWRGGQQVENWKMGLATREREPKASFALVRQKFAIAPHFPLARYPRISVIVACYNGERTLEACLKSLERLNYPDYEVLLVDDGSTDKTAQIATRHPSVRYQRQIKNLGLSVARNAGLAAATGEIVAFTDADCRADEDWLYYLANELLDSEFAGLGGPNLLPPEDSPIAAAVMVSPGGPAHVMLTDRHAEHIPGCNMAFYASVLAELGGFDPIFRKAGDDVDICWRMQQAGHRIGFSPAAFVWHYRRSAIADYLKQQLGYGEAEALLVRKHPEYFNFFGGSLWRGRIYSAAKYGPVIRPAIIYRGPFGSAGFQTLYASEPARTLMLCTTLEYHVLVVLPLWILSVTFHYLLPLAITSLLVPIGVCVAAAAQADLPQQRRHWWSRPLVAMLFLLQPLARGWARYQHRLKLHAAPLAARQNLDSLALRGSKESLGEVSYWTEGNPRVNRLRWVADLLRRLDQRGWPNRSDIGWSDYDVEIYDTRWSKLQLTTVVEDHSGNRQLIRCRLRTRWVLRAKIAFWSMFGFEFLLCGFVGTWLPWLWCLLLTLPLFIWYLRREQRNLQSLIVVFLDDAAKDWKLAKIQAAPSRKG